MARLTLSSLTKHYDDGPPAVASVNLEVDDGEFIVLVGPSGCGKSTLLRLVAGFETPSAGAIAIGERDVTSVRPRDRDVAMVFQNYALYPHKTVRGNLEFGLKRRRLPRAEITDRTAAVAATLGIAELLDRLPDTLSGGQRQRVAIGRAMVREPALYLMDEPLSNLDAKLRVAMRAELATLHARLGVTTLYVTHDQTEAMTLGARVCVLARGVVQQVGTPRELFERPRNRFVAGFIGSPPMNFMVAEIDDGQLVHGALRVPIDTERGRALAGRRVAVLGIRPDDIQVAAHQPAASDEVHVRVRPTALEYLGSTQQLRFALAPGATELYVAVVEARARLTLADDVTLSIPCDQIALFDADDGSMLDAIRADVETSTR